MEQSLVNKIKEGLSLEGLDPKSYSPLSLAYIGDAIYEIVIRTIVMSAGNMSVNKYHKKSIPSHSLETSYSMYFVSWHSP